MIDLSEFPADQRELIEERLGKARTAALADEAKTVTGFYVTALREMGSMEGGGKRTKMPSPAYAWMEVAASRKSNPFDSDPTFSHPMVAKAVAYLGGWQKMWADFSNDKRESQSRNRYVMAYKELSEKA